MPSQPQTIMPPETQEALRQLGDRLRAHRLRLGWTISDMAQRLLCAPGTYRGIEAGRPGTRVGLVASALWLLGQLETLNALAPITPELASALVRTRRMRRARAAAPPGTIGEDERDF